MRDEEPKAPQPAVKEVSEGEAIAARGGSIGRGDVDGFEVTLDGGEDELSFELRLESFDGGGSPESFVSDDLLCLDEKDCSKGFGSLSKSERVVLG